MPTQLTGGGTATSFTNTPQAKDDTYLYLEDLLRANSTLYNSYTNTILLDVMSNDLGGGAKALFSVYEGDGDLLDDDFELLVKDVDASGASPWERTQGDNWVRINNGKIEFRIAKPGDNDPDHALSIDSLTDGQNFVDEFVYAIRLGNGTLSEAIVRINITGAQDNATVVAAPDGDYGVTEAGGVANGTPGDPSAHGQLLITDADLGENHFQTPASLDGTYGKFTFDPTTGAWTYLLDNSRPATEGLDDGDVVSDSLTVTSADGTASHTITVTINGTDDQPTLAAVTAGSLAEVDQSSATTPLGLSGVLSGTDVDGDTLTYGVVGGTLAAGVSTLASAYGTLSVNTASGAYNFVPNSAIEGLDDGETATVNFTMAVSDGDGPSVTQTYTITLTGADDAPTLAAVTAGSLAEVDQSSATTPLGLSGVLSGTDVDGDTLTYGVVGGTLAAGVSTLASAYGTLSVNTASGAYNFVPNSAIEGLDDGETATVNFTMAVSDGDGPSVTQTYTITLTGADDAPTLAAVTAGSLAEVDQSSATTPLGLSGVLSGTDVDGDTLTYGVVGGTLAAGVSTLASAYGTLSVNTASGAYNFVPNSAIEGLDDGETATVNFTMAVSDGDGPSVTQTYTITLTGADDAPTLAAVTAGSLAEVDQSSATTPLGLSGVLSGTDVDGDTLTYGVVGGTLAAGVSTLASAYGTLSVNTASGAYNFVPNSAIEGLDDGETATVNFTMAVSDGDGPSVTQTYTITLTGADDAPTLAAVTAGSLAEVDQSSATTPLGLSGVLSGTDVDGDTLTYGVVGGTLAAGVSTLASAYGTLSVNTASGAYNFVPNSAIEGLDDGETATVNFTMAVSDGDGPSVTQTYTITLTGADDAPTLAAVTAGSLAEVDQSSATTPLGLSGVLSGTDVDGDTLTYGVVGGTLAAGVSTLASAYGTLSVNTASGAYNFVPNSAIEGLDDGETATVNFTMAVSDGDGPSVTQTYTITLTGADDAPTLAAVTAGSLAEVDQSSATTPLGLSGVLSGTDVDGDTLTYGVVGGTLAAGVSTLASAYGTLSVNTASGAYNFVPNSAIEGLDDGETATVNFTMAVSDGDGPSVTQTYTITLTGADDAPTLAAVTAGSLAEVDQSSATTPLGLSGVLSGTDVDGDTLTYGVVGGTLAAGVSTLASAYGTLSVNTASGAYNFVPNSAIEGLDDGETATVNFTMAVSDGDGPSVTQTYTITLTGADDAPTLAAVTAGSLAEVDQSSATTPLGLSGVLSGTDVDGDTLTYGVVGGTLAAGVSTLASAYGTLSVNTASGAYNFVPNSAIEGLDDGETATVNFTMAVSDGDGPSVTQTYTITLTGADDAPTLAAVTAGSLAEVDQSSATTPLGLSGVLSGTDVDGDTLTYGVVGGTLAAGVSTLASAYGTLSVNTASGAYNFVPNSAIEGLDDGETATVNFTMAVSDGDGPSVTQTYTITLTGADDAPTLAAVTAGSLAEVDQSSATTPLGLSGVLSGTDVDGDTLTYGVVGGTLAAGVSTLASAYGTLSVNTASGAYNFVPNSAIEGLDDGETATVNFTMAVSDGDGPSVTQTYTITLTGADDAPTLAAVTAGSLAEVDQSSATTPLGLSGVLSGTDVDGDTLTYGVVGGTLAAGVSTLASAYGTLSVNTASGAYNFVPNSAIEGLDDGETATVNFTMAVSDGDGPSVTQTYTITLTGADDAPTLAAVTAGSVVEVPNSTSTTDSGLTGNLVGADVDVETLTYGIVGGTVSAGVATFVGTYGTLTVNTFTGAYAYTKNAAAIEALNTGQNPSDTFTVTVSDGDGPTVNQTYTVNITGADDALAQNVITNLALGTGIVIPEYALLYTGGFRFR